MTERVVVLVDMDCFYVQVEEREQPHLRGKPAAVVQYNSWRGGGIIAVNYEARGFGVKRGMRGDQAREKCPHIHLVQVPVNRGKADLTKYREAGKEVIDVLVQFSDCIERASIDEAYVDLTAVVEKRMAEVEAVDGWVTMADLSSTWVVGYTEEAGEDGQGEREAGLSKWLSTLHQGKEEAEEEEEEEEGIQKARSGCKDDLKLALAAVHCEEMRQAVYEKTSFRCSAGIAHNKMLAKLSCGLHKPNQQTVTPQARVQVLWDGLPVGKVRNLGGKLGDSLTESLGCVTMGDLSRVSLGRLAAHYDHKTAHWLHSLGRGVDTEPVTSRQLAKSIGCGKNFQGRETLDTPDKVRKWTRSLADELSERLEADKTANKRTARTLTVGVRVDGEERWCSLTRSCRMPSYEAERIARVALTLFQHTNTSPTQDSWSPSIKHISLSAGKFEDLAGIGSANIQEMFKKAVRKAATSSHIPATSPNIPATSPNIPATSPNIPATSPNIPATSPNIPATSPNIPATSPASSSTFLSPKTPSTSFFSPKTSSSTSFLSPKTPSTSFLSPKTLSNSFSSTPKGSSVSLLSPSSSSSSPSSSTSKNTEEEEEEEEDCVLLDDSNTQAATLSQSQAFEEAPSQLEPSTHTHTEEPTNTSAVKVKQGRVSFPSQVSSEERSEKVKSGVTNSFFKNFLLKKLKGDSCVGDGKEGGDGACVMGGTGDGAVGSHTGSDGGKCSSLNTVMGSVSDGPGSLNSDEGEKGRENKGTCGNNNAEMEMGKRDRENEECINKNMNRRSVENERTCVKNNENMNEGERSWVDNDKNDTLMNMNRSVENERTRIQNNKNMKEGERSCLDNENNENDIVLTFPNTQIDHSQNNRRILDCNNERRTDLNDLVGKGKDICSSDLTDSEKGVEFSPQNSNCRDSESEERGTLIDFESEGKKSTNNDHEEREKLSNFESERKKSTSYNNEGREKVSHQNSEEKNSDLYSETREKIHEFDSETKENVHDDNEEREKVRDLYSEEESLSDLYSDKGENMSDDSDKGENMSDSDSEGVENMSNLDILVSLLDTEENTRETDYLENTKGNQNTKENTRRKHLLENIKEKQDTEENTRRKDYLENSKENQNTEENTRGKHNLENTKEEQDTKENTRETDHLENTKENTRGKYNIENTEGNTRGKHRQENTRETITEEDKENNTTPEENKEPSHSPELFSSWEMEKCKERITNRTHRRNRTHTLVKGNTSRKLNLQADTSTSAYNDTQNNATNKSVNLQGETSTSRLVKESDNQMHLQADTSTSATNKLVNLQVNTSASSTRETQNSATNNMLVNRQAETNGTAPNTTRATGKDTEDSGTGETEPGTSGHSAKECQQLAQELFPDLDNIDASLLPLLPEELRVEIEAQLARHSNNDPKHSRHSNNDPKHPRHSETNRHSPQKKTCIRKFMQRSPKKSESHPPSVSANSDLVECQECHKAVSPFDLPEHLDYHVALKLQSDLRRQCEGQVTGQVSRERGKKRGRASCLKSDGKKIQKLDAFFTR